MAGKAANEGQGNVAPRAASLCYFLSSLLTCSAVALAAVFLWSMLGWGEDCLSFVKKYSAIYYVSGAFVIGILLALYLLDFFWPPHLQGHVCCLWKGDRWVGNSILTALLFAAGIGVSTMAEDYPWAPLLVTIFLCPIVLGGTFMVVGPYHTMETNDDKAMLTAQVKRMEHLKSEEQNMSIFYRMAQAAVLLIGFTIFIVWVLWISADKEHWKMIQDAASREEKEELFILWVAPLMITVGFFSFAFLIRLRLVLGNKFFAVAEVGGEDVTRTESTGTKSSIPSLIGLGVATVTQNNKPDMLRMCIRRRSSAGRREFDAMETGLQNLYLHDTAVYIEQVQHVMKWLGTIILIILACNYVSYQLKPFNKTAQLMVQAYLVLLSMTSVVFLYVSFSELWNTMGQWLVDLSLVKTAIRLSSSDWARGLGVFCLGPILPAFLALSALNQCVRRLRGLGVPSEQPVEETDWVVPVKAPPKEAPKDAWTETPGKGNSEPKIQSIRGIFTPRVEAFLQRARCWEWLIVLKWAYVFAFAAIIYTITPILLKPFLAWMVSILRSESFIAILGAVWLIGLLLFLLPPVPGAPVYLFGGVLVSGKGETDEELGWGSPAGFWYGSLICIVVCWILKLSACAVQQKLIGEMLSGSLWIRRTVGVHKPLMRAIELVLRRPGLSPGKVVILCGGPDWPTSVLAGVLRLSLLQCEIGTMPIITYIAPLSLTGSFYYKRSSSEMWKNAGDLMFTLTAIMTVAYWAGIGWIVEDTYEKESLQLSKHRASDVDLFWLDYRGEEISRACAVTWADLPSAVQVAFVLGCVGLVAVGQVFYWCQESLFGSFEVTQDMSELSFYGKDGSLFTTASLTGLPVALLCLGGYGVFILWHRAKTRKKRIEAVERLRIEEPAWKQNFLQQVQAEAASAEDEVTEIAANDVQDSR